MTDFCDGFIGLIADSHGNLEATGKAIGLLKRRGAHTLVHLGDFCDSVRQDRTAEMMELLEGNSVLTVKGNNDFLVENMLAESRRPLDPMERRMLSLLRETPVTRSFNGLHFAHSLPFDSLRSFYEPIDTGDTLRAERLFAETDFQLLFCGHSHLPVIFRKSGGRVTREPSTPCEKRQLGATCSGPRPGEDRDSQDRFIVVVGAADEGECALYGGQAGGYERLRIFD